MYYSQNAKYTKSFQLSLKSTINTLTHQILKSSSPLQVILKFFIQRPKSHFVGSDRQKGNLKPKSPVYHTQTPDVDNLSKFTLDCLKKIIFSDDRVVIKLVAEKFWTSGESYTEINVSSAD